MKIGLASDFDNTLYFMFEEEKYRPGDLEAIRAFQAKGGLFGVSTGRSLQGVRKAALDDVAFDFYILATGSLVLDKDLCVLDRHTVDIALVKELYERYGEMAEAVIQGDDTVYSFKKDVYGLQTPIQSFADIAQSQIYGISFYAGTAQNAHAITTEIQRLYGTHVTAYENTSVLDVVSRDCSKGTALKTVKKALLLDRLGAIGDSYNDVPMLREGDCSFTFPYAPDSVQQEADHIVTTMAEALTLL